jgi:hypothetical protein
MGARSPSSVTGNSTSTEQLLTPTKLLFRNLPQWVCRLTNLTRKDQVKAERYSVVACKCLFMLAANTMSASGTDLLLAVVLVEP